MLRDEVVQGSVEGVHVEEKKTEEELKREETLRKSEEKFRGFFEKANDCMVYLDRFGRILDVNAKAVEVFGGSREELLGKHFTKAGVFSLKDIPSYMSAFAEALAGKQVTRNVCIKNKKGREMHLEISGSLMKIRNEPVGLFIIARDITERKKAEEALRESEKYLEEILNSVLTGVVVVDEKAHEIVDANPNALKIIGASKEHVIGKVCHSFICPAEKGKCPISDLGQTVDRSERVLLRANGERIPILKTVTTTMWRGHKYLIESFIDITERKRAEEELIRLSSAVKMSTDSIVISDLNGKIIDVNEATRKMYGTDNKKDLIEKNSFDLIAPEEREKAFAGMKEVLEKGYVKGREYHVVTKDGSRISVEMSVSIMKDAEGKPIGFVGISRDITERKEMEEKLRQYSERLEELVQKRTEELLESEKRYSVLVEEASDGVAMIQEGKIVLINKRASDISGYSKDELIGLSFEKLLCERHRQLVKERYMRRLRGETVPVTYEVEFITKTGKCVPVEVSASCIRYQGRPADLTIVRDVRERKRMEEQRLRLEKLVTIGELATMVGHDLRNPLQSIENAAYYLNNELSNLSTSVPMSQKTKEMLRVINDSTNYADKIIRDLQDFSTTKPLTLEKTDINALVMVTLSQIQTSQNVELQTELEHLPEINVDKDQIKRVFLNLTTNAMQAMENGGTLTVSTKKIEGFVEVSFKDTGVGIPKEKMEKLFTPFYTTKAKGMGMGLSICKKFVEAHGGSIEVESQVGKGTTFTVKLPIQQENGGEKT